MPADHFENGPVEKTAEDEDDAETNSWDIVALSMMFGVSLVRVVF